MKILHVTPAYYPAIGYGGPIVSVHGLCQFLSKLGHEVSVFTTNIDGEKDSNVPTNTPIELDGVKVWYFKSSYFRRLHYAPGMKKALKELGDSFDVLHIHSLFTWPVTYAAKFAIKHRIPYIIAPRGMLVNALFKRKSWFKKTVWMLLFGNEIFKRANCIHVTSNQEVEDVRNYFKSTNENLTEKIFMVPNGYKEPSNLVEDADDSFNFDFDQSQSFILYLGRISWKKRIDILVDAVNEIEGIHLVIAGNDDEGLVNHFLKKIAKQPKLAGRVHFTGVVNDSQKKKLFNRALFMVLPSYSENFGMVVLESLAAECPVLVSEGVGLSEFVKRESVGCVSSGEKTDFVRCINEMISDKDKLREMGKKGRLAVEMEFNWKVISIKMQSIYQKIIKTC